VASRRVAACVITGFLGSGKTTLLGGLLARDPGRERIAVIVNELGEIGIDGRVLTGFEFVENVVELASGCVCCSIDEYRFDLAVDELVRKLDPTLLVLETTGVADPAPTLERLRRCGLGVDAVVTVVDASAWRVAWRVSRTARRQVAEADFLVISKCDLVSRTRIRTLRAALARLNPRALVLEGAGAGAFDGADLLLATSASRRRAPDGPQPEDDIGRLGHLGGDRIESFSWRSQRSVDRAAFERELAALPAAVLRAKGFLRAPGDSIGYLFQVVCGRVEWSGFAVGAAVAAGVQAIFIGPGVLELQDGITRRLLACEMPPVVAGPCAPAASQ